MFHEYNNILYILNKINIKKKVTKNAKYNFTHEEYISRNKSLITKMQVKKK